jgi:NTE family protein
MSYALVLGGGGVTGIAWETGLLKGLRDAGVDLTVADLIVGTSAGAMVGAQVATGVPLDELHERQVEPAGTPDRPPDLGPLMEFFSAQSAPGTMRTRPSRELLAWIGGQARAASTRFSEASRLKGVRARLPVHEWPERRLLVTAIDTADGTFVAWDRASGVPLPLAVASSCAVPWVYPPVTIGGRRYMDGGIRSATNADLAAGHDLVVVLAPRGAQPGLSGMSGLLEEEVGDLKAGGSRVELVAPDAAAIEAIGTNVMDAARRAAVAEAGRAQAATVAAQLAAIREQLVR